MGKEITYIPLQEWDQLVETTYNKIYSFQQQAGCRDRGTFEITVPCEDEDCEMNESIPEVVNGDEMGVTFDTWLARDKDQPLPDKNDYLSLFWERNFYPDIYTLANDLHARRILKAGTYKIDIDW